MKPTDVPPLTRALAEMAAPAPGAPGAASLPCPVPVAGVLVCVTHRVDTRGGNRGLQLTASLSLPDLGSAGERSSLT